MAKLEDLKAGLRLAGVIPVSRCSVIAAVRHGADVVELTYKTADGNLGQRVIGRESEPSLAFAGLTRARMTRRGGFSVVAECQRIKP